MHNEDSSPLRPVPEVAVGAVLRDGAGDGNAPAALTAASVIGEAER